MVQPKKIKIAQSFTVLPNFDYKLCRSEAMGAPPEPSTGFGTWQALKERVNNVILFKGRCSGNFYLDLLFLATKGDAGGHL